MQLNRLCFILPADLDEIEPVHHRQLHELPTKKDSTHRHCGAQILATLRHSLHRFLDSKWVSFCHDHHTPRRQASGVFHDTEGVELSDKVGGNNPRIFSYAELYIGSNGFSEDEVLGSGGFGRVYRAILPSDGTVVAVKCLAERGERFEKTFAAELVAVAHLRHRNLVRLRGWCVHEDQLLLVYDYMPNRSLDRILFRRPENMGRLSDEGKLLQAGDNRLPDGSYKLSDMEQLLHLGLLCTLHDPPSRPNMKWVVEALSGHIYGRLPDLPSFQSHPLYISLSSATNSTGSVNTTTSRSTTATSTTTTAAFHSSNFVTAMGETVYATAENGNSDSSSSDNGRHRPNTFPIVETPREISYKELVSATNNFSDSQRVAELDFGTAYHGFLDNRHHILVKRLGMKTCPALRARFSNELQNLGSLRHRNLVHLRGWCTEQGEMLVVYDYAANRLLSHLLFHHDHKNGHSVLPWHHRYNIIKSLAYAIRYLHEEWEEQVIHRNITSSAVVLDPDMNPRLSCFALAEFLTRNEHGPHVVVDKNRSVRGIFGYMSPEYMDSGEATTMADIYCFGVVVLEVVSGLMAVDFRRPEVLLVKRVHDFEVRKRPYEELADLKLNGKYDRKELVRLVKLGMACTRSNPELRPSTRQIVSILDGHDKCFMEEGQRKERSEEWKQRNASSLSLTRRIQALGIQ
ncbi:hypothetical protein F0562_000100 [Nyssa sinensis]|uniref:Protein kinase domain-containing protein n=1 Tax=Nyssa sinensis TaxID=561372 RepID=A0A5J5BZ56_9ASTE|nr:hypothetical protein F0562_000100 [Nyssa sinensis]